MGVITMAGEKQEKFEEALKKLEKIVQELENGKLSLDDSLKKYEDFSCNCKLWNQKPKLFGFSN